MDAPVGVLLDKEEPMSPHSCRCLKVIGFLPKAPLLQQLGLAHAQFAVTSNKVCDLALAS